MQTLEDRLRAIESQLETQDKILEKLWKRSTKNAHLIGRVELSCMTFLGFLLVVAFGIQIKTDWFDFDLSGETFARILEVSGFGAIAAALAKMMLDKLQKSDDE